MVHPFNPSPGKAHSQFQDSQGYCNPASKNNKGKQSKAKQKAIKAVVVAHVPGMPSYTPQVNSAFFHLNKLAM